MNIALIQFFMHTPLLVIKRLRETNFDKNFGISIETWGERYRSVSAFCDAVIGKTNRFLLETGRSDCDELFRYVKVSNSMK